MYISYKALQYYEALTYDNLYLIKRRYNSRRVRRSVATPGRGALTVYF